MAEKDPEKKFHSIMDKLFYAPPKSTLNASTSNESQLSRSKKRLNHETALALEEPQKRGRVTVEGTPLCRPWDRGKPKVVSAVNCATRGWTNLETDIIGCEVCGARLLFTTPSSWSHQQGLATGIGIKKYKTPKKYRKNGNRGIVVESFVSDKYQNLVKLAALR